VSYSPKQLLFLDDLPKAEPWVAEAFRAIVQQRQNAIDAEITWRNFMAMCQPSPINNPAPVKWSEFARRFEK
jgi:hypothetical protein